jgi:hypothetical protein
MKRGATLEPETFAHDFSVFIKALVIIFILGVVGEMDYQDHLNASQVASNGE